MAKTRVAWLCALMMLSPLMAVPSGADGAPEGRAEDRASISLYDVYDLQNISHNLNASYSLANDIDASCTRDWNGGAGFVPIGNGTYVYTPPYGYPTQLYVFRGQFDGKGHTITGLYINRPSERYVGLFGYANGAQIMNVSLVGVNITGSYTVGGLAGGTSGGSTVIRCSSSGTVTGYQVVGGLIGTHDYGSVSRCYSTSNVSGNEIVGGLVGYALSAIDDSYSHGAVKGGYDLYGGIGGFVGYMWPTSALVNCYSTGKVTGSGVVGGFVGGTWYGGGTWTNCFWDNKTSGWTTSAGGTGKNTTDMMMQATFTGWNFTGPWRIAENVSYPYLWSFVTPLEIRGSDVLSAREDMPYRAHYDAPMTYPFQTNNSWTLSTNATGWLSIDTAAGNLSGTPDNADVGPVWVNLTVINVLGYSASRNFTIVVENAPPVFSTVPAPEGISVDQDRDLSFDIGCDDEGLGGTGYGFVRAPDWLAVNSTSGALSGRPGNADVGRHTITLFADDGWGGRTNTTFDVHVLDVNDPPVITTADVLAATQGSVYQVVYEASDIDPVKETFTWGLETDAGWLKMDAATGLLSGNPANADVGSWWVNVSVDDGRGGKDSRNFTLVVRNVNDAPAITTEPAVLATQGAEYLVDFNATDIDAGDTLTWSLDTAADWLDLNSTSGELSGTPAEKDVGTVWVKVTVTDAAGAKMSSGFELRVQNVNDPPFWVLESGGINLTEGSWLFLDMQASDPDAGDTVRYSISSVPASGITVNPVSGAVRWANVTTGNYTVTVTATDGALSVQSLFNLTVNSIPVPPPPPSPPENNVPAISPVSNASATAEKTLSLKLTGSDADAFDAKNLTFRLVSGPAGLLVSADGAIVWTPTGEQAGTHTVTVSLSDGKNATTSIFTVSVAKPAAVAKTSSTADNSMGLMIGLLVAGLAIGAVVAYALTRRSTKSGSGEGKPDAGQGEEE